MKKLEKNEFELVLRVESDWEDLEAGVYGFKTFGDCEDDAVEFVKHLGKCVCGSFMDKLREELNRRAE